MKLVKRKRVAVVGAGVSGLGAAWALRETADVTLYESASRIGGHSHTVDVDYDGIQTPVDIGFICFNRPNYPNLTAMFQHLGVKTHWTDMSFAVSDPQHFEWSSDPWGLFAWKRNLVNPGFHALIREILHFNNVARRQLNQGVIPEMSLGDWLDAQGFSNTFRVAYLLPMSAAIWSTPEKEMLDYPVESFIQFFDNHRLMHTIRPIWRTVCGGSRTYVDALVADLEGAVRTSARIETIRPNATGQVQIHEQGVAPQTFDNVILACHADQSHRMLDPRFVDQRLALGSMRFSPNTAYLHRDASLMPERRSAWASWNVRKGDDNRVCVTYWMNRLQKIPNERPLFVTLNPVREPEKAKTFGVYEFDHPIYDGPSAAARRMITSVQGDDGLFFSGAWMGDGFHEAGLRTGLEAAYAIGGSVPWDVTLRNRYTSAAPQPLDVDAPRVALVQ